MKFLLVEDDESLASAIEQLLAEHHYVTDLATDGIMGRDMAEAFAYDLILLDWMLPKLDGMQLCKYLRNEGDYTPIILMTAKDASTDKVAGLDAGADDYLVKPFGFEELLARIRALLRRAEGIVSPVLQWGDLCLDPRSSEVTCRSIPVALTPKEYALLELFLRNTTRIFSLDNLLDRVWSFDDSPSVGSVRTHIKGLRQKLRKAGVPDIIETVYGLGYRIKTAISAPTSKTISTKAISTAVAEGPQTEESSVGKLDMASLWESVSQPYRQRVVRMVTTLRGLEPGLVEKSIQQSLLKEAHALAGSLGSFGFRSVTTQCREIESILQANAYVSIQHVQRLETLIIEVQQTLEQGLPSTAALTQKDSTAVGPKAATTETATTESATVETAIVSSAALVPPPPPVTLLPGQLIQLLLVEARGDRDQAWLQLLAETAPYYRIQVHTVDTIEQANSALFPEDTAEDIPKNDAEQSPPHIVIFDFDGSTELPDSDSSAFDLLAKMQTETPSISTIVLTAADSFENRVRVARVGVTSLLQTPVTPTEILETATRVMQEGAPPTASLLIVDDDPAMLKLLENLLQPWGFQLHLLSEPEHFWKTLERAKPDLVLLDVRMPNINGFDLCQVLRNSPEWHDLPVLFMSAHTDAQTIQQVFSAGADDYVRKPIVAPELVARVLGWLERSRIRKLNAEVDSLTGVANRRKSTQLLTQLLGLAQRRGETLCFALIDFDHLEQINNTYGHPVGDRVLSRFGERLQSIFRTEDVIGRWGGEEFVVGLYGVNRQEGVQRLKNLLQIWQEEEFEASSIAPSDNQNSGKQQPDNKQESPDTFKVTFTAGVAVYPHDAANLQGLYRATAKALHKAKAEGRNQVRSTID